jgi:hypothetical protein
MFKRFSGFPELRQLGDREVINARSHSLRPPSLRQTHTRVGWNNSFVECPIKKARQSAEPVPGCRRPIAALAQHRSQIGAAYVQTRAGLRQP